MLINTYFPQDPKCDDFDETDLLLTLSDIKEVIINHEFDRLIWAGDINADFKRNTKFVRIVEEFIDEMDLCKSWEEYQIDYTHAAEANDVVHVSTIDHFFWNSSGNDSIIEAGVLHLTDNLSDHSPVFCKMKAQLTKKTVTSSVSSKGISNPCWKKGTEVQKQDYCNDLHEKLQKIIIPTCVNTCSNVHCKNEMHKSALDNLMLDVLTSMEIIADTHTAKQQINNNSNKVNNTIPNWKTEIDPYKKEAHFWHSVWLSAGRPLNNHLHMIMKRTRNTYHHHIRKNKRMQDRVKRSNLFNSCILNNGNLFDDIKRQRKCNQTIATSIDGHNHDIPSHFANKYKKLYNSVDDEVNLLDIEENLKSKITQTNNQDISPITSELLKTASKKLKSGKSDPLLSLTSDFFVNAPPILYDLLASIMKSYIVHAHVSDFLLLSYLIPIIKDKLGDITSSNNYRSIAISSIVMKIFDWVIILAYNKQLKLDDLQFSYQPNVSTSMCSWMVVETISYFSRNGSDIFTCLMDMSKAFDTVQHSVLFKTLLEQGLPCIIVRFLLITYRSQQANVKWCNEVSDFFKIGNGVKQGAVLSAVLYCVYTNGLFEELRRLNVGCCIGQNYVGIVGYADDLFLMCPTVDGLQKMLKVCERYAESRNLRFSTDPNPVKSKTKCMAFLQKKRSIPNLMLCGDFLPWVESGKHLGTKIENKPGSILNQDMKEKRAQYIQRNNELMQEFSFANSITKIKIYAIFNSHFTGSVLWDLLGPDAEKIYNTWSTSVRKMFRLDRTTHRYFIEPISKMPHIKISFMKRFTTFTDNISRSEKISMRNMFNTIKKDCRSITGRNMRMISKYCNKLIVNVKEVSKQYYTPVPIHELWRVKLLEELLDIRDNKDDLEDFSKEEILDFIQYLCTT